MKKKLILLIALTCSGASLIARSLTFVNTTGGKVKIHIDLKSWKDKKLTLNPGQERKIGIGFVGLNEVRFFGADARLTGLRKTVPSNVGKGNEYIISHINAKMPGGGVVVNVGSGQTIVPGSGELQVIRD